MTDAIKMRLWWCGWDVPDVVPEEHKADEWPPEMQGWNHKAQDKENVSTGHAAVWALSAEAAWELVLSCYGGSRDRISKRVDPKEMADDFAPDETAFPGFYLKKPVDGFIEDDESKIDAEEPSPVIKKTTKKKKAAKKKKK